MNTCRVAALTLSCATDLRARERYGAEFAGAGGSESEEEQEEQMRMTFLGDVRKGGKGKQKGVLAALAEEPQVRWRAPLHCCHSGGTPSSCVL